MMAVVLLRLLYHSVSMSMYAYTFLHQYRSVSCRVVNILMERMKVIKETRERFGRFFYRFPEGESAADVYDHVSRRSGDCKLDGTEAYRGVGPGIDSVAQFDSSKLGETCVLVDGENIGLVSYREDKSQSYKKKIRKAFSSKKSARKQEYQQLAVQYGDLDTRPNRNCLSLIADRIGYVSTGLKEDEIVDCLSKTKGLNNMFSQFPTKKEWKCSICQEDYEAENEVGKLECGHFYHFNCIKQWLLLKNVCPICKTEAAAQHCPPPLEPHEGVYTSSNCCKKIG